jgi:branched-subunit amino acid aminotransferase/4-amino-4-deoxychorismate lyase
VSVAWIGGPGGGRWGVPGDLGVPLDDRGLLLADGIFETVLVERGRPRLLRQHLKRWHSSAALLGMAAPPPETWLAELIEEAIARAGLRPGRSPRTGPEPHGSVHGALRLNWSRGAAGATRGLDLPEQGSPPPPGAPEPRHRFWLELRPARPAFTPVRLIVSRTERRVAGSVISLCKTFAYAAAIQARREARAAGADDALLESTAGGLCCGTSANLLVRRQGCWLTPPLAGGCLPGVMRGRALALGLAAEAALTVDDLLGAEAAVLINSLGCRPIVALAGRPIRSGGGADAAEALWRSLLKAESGAGFRR